MKKANLSQILEAIDVAVRHIHKRNHAWSCCALQRALNETTDFSQAKIERIVGHYGDFYKEEDSYLRVGKVDMAGIEIANHRHDCDIRTNQDEFRIAMLLNYKEYLLAEQELAEKKKKAIAMAARFVTSKKQRYTCVGLSDASRIIPEGVDLREEYRILYAGEYGTITQMQLHDAVYEILKLPKNYSTFTKKFEDTKDELRLTMLGFFSAMQDVYI